MGLLFGDRRGTTRTGISSGSVEFALDLTTEAVTLCERKPHGSWRKFASVRLDDPEFSTVIGLLRDDSETYAGARLPVRLWLPAEQVLKKTVRLKAGAKPEERLQAAFDYVEEKTVYRPEDVAIAIGPVEPSGETTILITFAQTWREARIYAERWGFLPGEVSTRHEAEAFGTAGPVFLLGPEETAAEARKSPNRKLVGGIALTAVAAVLALAVLRPWEPAPDLPAPAPPPQAETEPAEATPPQEPVSLPPAAPVLSEPDGGKPPAEPATDLDAEADSGQGPAPAELPAAPTEPNPIAPVPDPLAARQETIAPEPLPPLDAPNSGASGAETVGIQLDEATGPADPRTTPQAPQVLFRAPETLSAIAPPTAPGPAVPVAADPVPEVAEPEITEPVVAERTVAEPGVPEIGVLEIGVPEADVAEPDITGPVVPEPDVSGPDAAEPAQAEPGLARLEDVELGDAEPEVVDDPAWPLPPPRPEPPAVIDRDAPTPAAVPSAPLPKARPAHLSKIRAAVPSRIGSGAKIDSAALVGVMNLKTGRKALLRLPDGSFRSVVIGDVLDGWKVTMIGPDEMRVTQKGRDRTLQLVRP